MKESDLTIFEYRMKKEIKFTDIVKEERLKSDFEKISFRTGACGYVDGYIYRPVNAEEHALPVVFNFHGGGMVLGYCEQDGEICRKISNEVRAAVINVDYPLAPEFKYPKPVYGAYEFIEKVLGHADQLGLNAESIQLMGHSAGGYLACAVCVLNGVKKGLNINGLAVNYPIVRQYADCSMRRAEDPSKAISPDRMEQYLHWYIDDLSGIDEPLASPLNAEPSVFPRTMIFSAEYDSLREEEKKLAQKLKDAGIDVQYHMFKKCMHGFTHSCFDEYNEPAANKAWEQISAFLKNGRRQST